LEEAGGAGGGATASIKAADNQRRRLCRKMEQTAAGSGTKFLLPVVGSVMARHKSGLSRGPWNSGLSEAKEHMPRKPLYCPDRQCDILSDSGILRPTSF